MINKKTFWPYSLIHLLPKELKEKKNRRTYHSFYPPIFRGGGGVQKICQKILPLRAKL